MDIKSNKRICVVSEEQEKLLLSTYWIEDYFRVRNISNITVTAYKIGSIENISKFSRAAGKLLSKAERATALEKPLLNMHVLHPDDNDLIFAVTESDFRYVFDLFDESGNCLCADPAVEDNQARECLFTAIRDNKQYGKRCGELYALRHYSRSLASLYDTKAYIFTRNQFNRQDFRFQNLIATEWPELSQLKCILLDALHQEMKKNGLFDDPSLASLRFQVLCCLTRKEYENKVLDSSDFTVATVVATAKKYIPRILGKDEGELVTLGCKNGLYDGQEYDRIKCRLCEMWGPENFLF